MRFSFPRVRAPSLALLGLCCALILRAQSPDASIRGAITDAEGKPLSGAKVTVTHTDTGWSGESITGSRGEYAFDALPRGSYSVRAEKAGYQARMRQSVNLAVGDKLQLSFQLSHLSGKSLPTDQTVFMPPPGVLNVDTVTSSVSVVVDENKILQLPLASRNIYSLFLLQPGVTSQGAIVRRGLSFSVHGQRVSGSNYLLDGIDNNNIVLTGPVTAVSAEAVQEFRMINSSFSAENGRATSFISQVVTRSGANHFFGSVYEFFSHDQLNANTFENNSSGLDRSRLHQNQFGYSAGGPIRKGRDFFFSNVEASRLRYAIHAGTALVPSPQFIAGLPADSPARRLLTEAPPRTTTATTEDPSVDAATFEAANRIDTLLLTQRLDHHSADGKGRLIARYSRTSTDEEHDSSTNFGYPTLLPTDEFRAHNAMLSWIRNLRASRVSDFRIGWSRERISRPRPRSDIPLMESFDRVLLPSNERQSPHRENNNVLAVSENIAIGRGRFSLRAGFEFRRSYSNRETMGLEAEAPGGRARFLDGYYVFPGLDAFAASQPIAFAIAVDRFSSGALRRPALASRYRSNELAGYAQNEFKLSRRLSVNAGLRYEYFGVPHDQDRSRDVNFYFGPGSTIEERLANGVLRRTAENPGDLHGLLYRRDRLNFAPSIGLAWDPLGGGKTVVRAGYAVAYDRIFDTLRDVSTNNQQVAYCFPDSGCVPQFLLPVDRMLPLLDQRLGPGEVVQLDEDLRTPYAQNWYFGVQHKLAAKVLVEAGYAGSAGRKLVSRDEVNRNIRGIGPLNPQILDDTFLSNAGSSTYMGLEIGVRQQFSRNLQYQVSYTYSHAIDNQSDLLEGIRWGPEPDDVALARFTRQFDARVDRGNANFDQKHNLVFNAIWELPARRFQARWANALTGGWTASVIGAYRSGFPVTVVGSLFDLSSGELLNNRADLIGTSGYASPRPAVPGGVQWLDPAQFRPATDRVGTLGRGALQGPGFWNYDFALLKSVAATERMRVQFRAEFYNLFNHANLSVPFSLYGGARFGRAFYGVSRTFSRFGDLPLDNPARRIKIGIRIRF